MANANIVKIRGFTNGRFAAAATITGHRYCAVTGCFKSGDRALWCIHAQFAIEFYTRAPLAADEERLRFARILLLAPPGVGFERVKLAVRALLFEEAQLEAVALLDGGAGMALWAPLADAPHAKSLR